MRFNLYGPIISLAILVGLLLTSDRARRRGLSTDFIWESLPWLLTFGVIGARLYHVFNFLPFYLANPLLIPQVWLGGLGIFGGILGGLLGLFLFANFKFSPMLRSGSRLRVGTIFNYLDAAAPAIPLAQAIGRLGNVFNGELLPYAYWELAADVLIFLFLIFINQIQSSNLSASAKASADWLALDSVEHSSRSNQKIFNQPFPLFTLYLLCYSVTRFCLEFFRTDSPWIVGPLTMAQWVSLTVVFLLSIRTVLTWLSVSGILGLNHRSREE